MGRHDARAQVEREIEKGNALQPADVLLNEREDLRVE
jgi:hypothetical protein